MYDWKAGDRLIYRYKDGEPPGWYLSFVITDEDSAAQAYDVICVGGLGSPDPDREFAIFRDDIHIL